MQGPTMEFFQSAAYSFGVSGVLVFASMMIWKKMKKFLILYA
jgi:hypothetical protein